MSDEKTIKEVTKERDELFSKVAKLVSFTTEQSVEPEGKLKGMGTIK